jgi:hypothetical protein
MSHPCGYRFWQASMLLLLALALGGGSAAAAHAQTHQPPPSAVRCPSPANPRTLYFECVGHPFDALEETLTKDWAGAPRCVSLGSRRPQRWCRMVHRQEPLGRRDREQLYGAERVHGAGWRHE